MREALKKSWPTDLNLGACIAFNDADVISMFRAFKRITAVVKLERLGIVARVLKALAERKAQVIPISELRGGCGL